MEKVAATKRGPPGEAWGEVKEQARRDTWDSGFW